MIVQFTSHEGGLVTVESAAIVAVTVGSDPETVLIHTAGWRFIVSDPLDTVLSIWRHAQEGQTGVTKAQWEAAGWTVPHPGVYPLVTHQYPDPATVTPPPWKPKAGWPGKEAGHD